MSNDKSLSLPSPAFKRRPSKISLHSIDNPPVNQSNSQTSCLNDPCHVTLDAIRDQIVRDQFDLIGLATSALGRAMRIGTQALKAKSLLMHGQFTPWVESELTPRCGLTLRTIQRYMKLALGADQLNEPVRRRMEAELDTPVRQAEIDDAILEMQIDDAFEMLRTKKPRNRQDRCLVDEPIDLLQKLAEAFFCQLPARLAQRAPQKILVTSDVQSNALIVPESSRKAKLIASDCLDAAEADADFTALLYLHGTSADRHGWLVDRFPRVHLRKMGADTHKNRHLFGLIPEPLHQAFFDVFEPYGVVLVPYRDLSSTTHSQSPFPAEPYL